MHALAQYALYCAAEVVLLLAFAYARVTGAMQMALFLVSALGEAFVAYHVWTFFRSVPTGCV